MTRPWQNKTFCDHDFIIQDGLPQVASDASFIDMPLKCSKCGEKANMRFEPVGTVPLLK